MKTIHYGILLIAFPAGVFGAEMTFDEIVKSVARRESRTGAILSVRASKEARAQG
ncbi:MAG: hypothetical protein IH987_03825, partial [Planctomycetes bacterium]|nr:hypothetical protein [Planctomycetota bacterium]